MAKELQSSIQMTLAGRATDALDLSTPEDALSKTFRDTLASGLGLDQADVLWHDRRALGVATEELCLTATLTDGLGDTVTFNRVKCIAIFNNLLTVGAFIEVGGQVGVPADTFDSWVNADTDAVIIGPGGCFLLWNPSLAAYTSTGAPDTLLIGSNNAAGSYDIIIIGTSAAP